jgi:hypothetical protein
MVVDEDSLVLVENPENNSALETINDVGLLLLYTLTNLQQFYRTICLKS